MSHAYHEILGIRENAKAEEIKLAYRRLAKKYHPDISKDPQAHEKFILVNEAYEFMLKQLKYASARTATPGAGGRYGRRSRPGSGSTYRRTRPGAQNFTREQKEEMYREWVKRERAKARARAEQAAKQKFEEFRKSDLYKTANFIYTFYDVFSILIGLLIFFAASLGLIFNSRSDDGITANNIIAAIFLCFLGFMFIAFSVSSIRSRYKKI